MVVKKIGLGIGLHLILILSNLVSHAQDGFWEYKQQYVKDLYEIIKEDTSYIQFFKYRPNYKVVARVEPLNNEPVFKLQTSSGKTKDAQKYAVLHFTLKGKKYKLSTYQILKLKEQKATENELFLPFTDRTNSKTTYGGGRYIDLNTKNIVDGKVTIDFNKAYNPYCAFATGYNCPIPPSENYIDTKIEAGESYNALHFQKEENKHKKVMINPLLQPFNTPFQSVPFNSIKNEDFKPAIIEGIAAAKSEIASITAIDAVPTFENTIIALENTGKLLNRTTEAFFNLTSAETNDYLEKVQEEVSPLLAEYGNDITLNEALFEKVKSVYENIDRNKYDTEDLRLLDKTYKSFARNGALLSKDDKEKLRTIDKELAMLGVKFSQNVLQETNAFQLHLTTEADVAGIPPSIKEQAAAEAKKKNLDGWVFTLQYPSFVPFITYASNRERRKEMYLANGSKAFKNNQYNNEQIIKDIVNLRDDRAKLLGFKNHADFVLAERMASNPETVTSFLNDLLSKAKTHASRDVMSLQPGAAKDGIDGIMPFDHAYYAEKLKEEKFSYSEEELKPYFALDTVLKAAFAAAERLYNLTFVLRNDIEKYHPDVAVYEVLENGNHKALLYCDWHPRKGKRAGAWMTSFKGQYMENGLNSRPHIAIVCNFSPANENTPSLLTFNEVTTLFHEFGHALHGILANTKYQSLSGTSVYWDFVELPSQFMENYCYQKEFLATFAKHYQTGEVLASEKIDKIVASANFMEGYQTLRQLSFGMLDMAYHTGRLTDSEPLEQFEKNAVKETILYPTVDGVAQSASFSHIFAGGYAAGYYSYKWSEVLDADAFSLFKEKGIFDEETAAKFKTLLSKGGTEDPMKLYIDFRGRKPEVDALLDRAGLK